MPASPPFQRSSHRARSAEVGDDPVALHLVTAHGTTKKPTASPSWAERDDAERQLVELLATVPGGDDDHRRPR